MVGSSPPAGNFRSFVSAEWFSPFGSRSSEGSTPSFPSQDGSERHQAVCPSRWCVTRQDLFDFREIVRVAVAEGRIVPTEWDNFDPLDNSIGPSVTTVTRQLVTPLTREAGKASWALSLHPDGLECDLFITHSWQEGVYEFVDKVLHSWPRRARHAYCCMLSNPQNLDIADLISTPESSPFAKALKAASYMLVVPNSSCSIYTRIWCVYEAFLAYKWNKPIFTASRPCTGRWFCLARGMLRFGLAAIVGYGLTGRVLAFQAEMWLFWALILIAIMCGAATMFTTSHANYAANLVGGVVSGIFSGFSLALASTSIVEVGHFSAGLLQVVRPRICALNGGMVGLFFVLREVDRLFERQAKQEAAHLHNGYTGKLQDAQSSVASDRELILREIREKECQTDVERAIQVLIDAGMSSPGLRLASMHGVDVSGAANWSFAMVTGMLFIFVSHPLSYIVLGSSCDMFLVGVPWLWLKVAEGVAWMVLFCRLDPDQRGFAALAGIKLGALPYGAVWILWLGTLAARGDLAANTVCVPDTVVGAFGCGPLMLAVSVLNLKHCLGVPVLGLPIVRLLFANTGRVRKEPTLEGRNHATPSTDDSADSSDSSQRSPAGGSDDEDLEANLSGSIEGNGNSNTVGD